MKGRGGPPRRDLDFASIARDLLHRAEQLVPQWLPNGRRDGHEWRVGSLAGEAGRSLAINLRTGVWADFADDTVKGGDLLSLYAAMHRLSMGKAARELGYGDQDAPGGSAAATPQSASLAQPSSPKPRSQWTPVVPAPADAPDYRTQWGHYARGVPERHWEYRDAENRLLGVVCRFETSDGGKDILPLTWCTHPSRAPSWRYLAFPEPRPLYGLARLAARPEALVVVVEGEKCADALNGVLDGPLVAVSWPGGGKAVALADWRPLRGRRVVLWPDHDQQVAKPTGKLKPPHLQPGIAAMERIAAILDELECTVRIVDLEPLGKVADGWDVADAVDEGWTRDAIWQHLSEHLRAPGSLAPSAAQASAPTPAARAGETSAPEMPRELEHKLLMKRGEIIPCTANVYALVRRSSSWDGVIAFDEFAQRVVKLKAPPYAELATTGDWEAHDDSMTAMWLARAHGFTPSSALVAETVEVLARTRSFHPVREYLGRLVWDGTPRLDHWLVDCLGAPRTEYTRLVGRFYLLGMVRRVMLPGSKFDYCMVLEGPQGMFKSTALRVLGGVWFKDTDLDLQNKDAMSALQGVWLYEIAELDALGRAESSKQKSFLSRQVDEFRPVYGRREVRLPRQCVFAGTTNTWEWNNDPTGGRRFWPVEVTEVDLDALAHQRDQLFAEALHLHRAGEVCYPTREQQRELFDPEQLKRQRSEGYIDPLHDWVHGLTREFSMAEAVTEGLKLDLGKLTRDLQTRVGNALKSLGCTRVERRNGMTRFWYKPPARKAASSTSAPYAEPAQPSSGGADDAPLPI